MVGLSIAVAIAVATYDALCFARAVRAARVRALRP